MTSLKEPWLQESAATCRVPALRPACVKALLPTVEAQTRAVLQQAFKFTRRGKGGCMTVADLNSALKVMNAEPLYGFKTKNGTQVGENEEEKSNEKKEEEMKAKDQSQNQQGQGQAKTDKAAGASSIKVLGGHKVISLVELAKAPLPRVPLLPELSMHWLAVDGVQPLIKENPSQLAAAEQQLQQSAQLQLPKEMRQFYYRATSILSASIGPEDKTAQAVLTSLRTDKGLQELLPHLSEYIQREVKSNTKNLRILRSMLAAVSALWWNDNLSVEYHLQQMLPAVFTCIIAARLGEDSSSSGSLKRSHTDDEKKAGGASASSAAVGLGLDHWALRVHASKVLAKCCARFSAVFPDLQARVCKTYVAALQDDKVLATLYGGIHGLAALGQSVVRSLLLPAIPTILRRLDNVTRAARMTPSVESESLINSAQVCSQALAHALGAYLSEGTRAGVTIRGAINGNGSGSGISGGNQSQQGYGNRNTEIPTCWPSLQLASPVQSQSQQEEEEDEDEDDTNDTKQANKKRKTGRGAAKGNIKKGQGQEETQTQTQTEGRRLSSLGFEETMVPFFSSLAEEAAHLRVFI